MLINLDSVIHKVYILLEEDHYKNSGWAVEKWNDEIVCTTNVDVRADSHKLEKKREKQTQENSLVCPTYGMEWCNLGGLVLFARPEPQSNHSRQMSASTQQS